MKRSFFILLLMQSFYFLSQSDTLSFESKMQGLKLTEKKYDWKYKNIFYDFKVSCPGSEILLYEPVKYVGIYQEDYSSEVLTKNYLDRKSFYTFFGGGIEPRMNLFTRNSNAFFLKAPISLNFSLVYRGLNNGVENNCLMHLNLPLLVGYGYGLQSTYTDCSKFGFAISAGVQYTRAPLLGNMYIIDDYLVDIFTEYNIQIKEEKNIVFPIVQFDYYYLNVNNKIRGISFTMGITKNYYFKLCYILNGSKK